MQCYGVGRGLAREPKHNMCYCCSATYRMLDTHLGGCQNYGPFLGTLNIRGRNIIGTQKRTIILTTSHLYGSSSYALGFGGAEGLESKARCRWQKGRSNLDHHKGIGLNSL